MEVSFKRISINTFTFIGVISTVFFIYNFIITEREAKEYAKRCKDVKEGMTVEKAKMIMGDYEWHNKNSRSEIWTRYDNSGMPFEYYLDYPARFGASGNPMIYFDPNTRIITRVLCTKE